MCENGFCSWWPENKQQTNEQANNTEKTQKITSKKDLQTCNVFPGFYVPKSQTSSTTSRTTSISTNVDTDLSPPLEDESVEDECDEDEYVDDEFVEDDLTEIMDQCELEEGWTTVPAKKNVRNEQEDVMSADDILVPTGLIVMA